MNFEFGLTEKLLNDWTGLQFEELDIFYLEYRKQSSMSFKYDSIECIKLDIIEFKKKSDRLENQRKWDLLNVPIIPKRPTIVSHLIHFWESKIKV